MKMPIRHRAHQLETLSVRMFESLLPANWVYRTPSDDYGIDGEVEIFDEKGAATGCKFLIQLKATDGTSIDKVLKLRMDIEKLNYYKAMDQPVLVVRYLAESNSVYTRWIHSLNSTTDTIAEKSFSMQFSNVNLWSEDSISAIEKDLEGYWLFKSKVLSTPVPIPLIFSSDALATGKSIHLVSPLLKAAKLSSVIKFIVKPNGADHTSFLNIDENELYLSLGGVASVRANFCLPSNAVEVEKCVANIMVHIAYLLQKIGHSKPAESIFELFYQSSTFIKDLEFLGEFLASKAGTNKTPDILQYLEWLIDRENSFSDELSNIIQLVTALYRLHSNSNDEEYHRSTVRLIDKYSALHPSISSVLSYNFGNFLWNQGHHRDAVHSYIKAAKLNPEYRDREYWQRELARLMFLIGKYKCSAALYKEFVSKTDSDVSKATGLLADSLLFSGDYKGALEQYKKALELKCEVEWNIKAWMVQSIIIEQVGLSQQIRGKDAGEKTNSFIGEESAQNYLENTNALCPDCWYYLANECVKTNQFYEAAAFFLLSAFIDGAYMDSWVNAFKCAVQSQSQEMIIAVVTCASERHGSEMITEAASSVSSNDPEFMEFIMDMISVSEDIHAGAIDKSFTLRIGGPDGIESVVLHKP